MHHAHDDDLSTKHGLSGLLSSVISEARKYGKVTGKVSDGEVHFSFTPNRAKQHPIAEEWNGPPFWSASTSSAAKKGWNWSGDTEVVVRVIHASSLKELLVSYIIDSLAGHLPADLSPAVSHRSWASFWDAAVTYDNDLPKWDGGPSSELVLQNDGNRRVMIAEKDSGTFYVVTFDKS